MAQPKILLSYLNYIPNLTRAALIYQIIRMRSRYSVDTVMEKYTLKIPHKFGWCMIKFFFGGGKGDGWGGGSSERCLKRVGEG